ncbi:MAG: tetratricopeptide repeat protein [Desulfobacteraceae bacterium]|nr:tetratricopeptide repeat protein [Desulfobacteraceae bacterium]
MITGQLPFKGEYEQAIVYSIINEEPLEIKDINPETSNVIEKIVSRALEKSPYKRFENVNIILKELKPAKVEPRSVLKEKAWILKEPKNQKRKWLLGFISLILICVLIIAYFNYNKRTNPFDSIAVLPFDNKNIEPALEYISEEIPASIINNLSGLKNLRVIPRSTVFKYKKGQDPISIGKKLDVSTILTGQIRVINGMINIRAELVDIKKNRQVWGKRYKQELKNIMEVEEKISRDISEALRFRLSREEKSQLTRHYTKIASAYQAYLQGRFWWNKRSRTGFNKAIKSFNKAIRIDPEYALAYSGKAECYCMLAIHAPLPEEFIKKGREAARRALAIDNTLAQAHTSLGWIKWIYDWDWIGAEQSFKTAISLNPDYPTAHNWYAAMLGAQGRHDKAFTHIQRAIQLDPGSLIINRDFGCIYSWAGKFDQAIQQLNKTIEMDPNFTPAHIHLGRVYVTKKMYKEAIVEFQKARDLSGDYYKTTGMLGFTFAKNGQKEKALQQLKILQEMEKKKPVSAFEMALIQTGLENNNMFFSWLEKACENHEFPVVLINVHMWLKHLHTDPRFKKLLKKVGLNK